MRKTPVSDLRPPQAGPYIHAPEHTHSGGEGELGWKGGRKGEERKTKREVECKVWYMALFFIKTKIFSFFLKGGVTAF